jgi:hypothetical protein
MCDDRYFINVGLRYDVLADRVPRCVPWPTGCGHQMCTLGSDTNWRGLEINQYICSLHYTLLHLYSVTPWKGFSQFSSALSERRRNICMEVTVFTSPSFTTTKISQILMFLGWRRRLSIFYPMYGCSWNLDTLFWRIIS